MRSKQTILNGNLIQIFFAAFHFEFYTGRVDHLWLVHLYWRQMAREWADSTTIPSIGLTLRSGRKWSFNLYISRASLMLPWVYKLTMSLRRLPKFLAVLDWGWRRHHKAAPKKSITNNHLLYIHGYFENPIIIRNDRSDSLKSSLK